MSGFAVTTTFQNQLKTLLNRKVNSGRVVPSWWNAAHWVCEHPRRVQLWAPMLPAQPCARSLQTRGVFSYLASPFSPVSLPIAVLKQSPNDELRDTFFLAYTRSLPSPPTKSIDHHWDRVTPGAARQQRAANFKRQIQSPLTVLSTSTQSAFPPSVRLCNTLLDWKEKWHMATTFGQRKSQVTAGGGAGWCCGSSNGTKNCTATSLFCSMDDRNQLRFLVLSWHQAPVPQVRDPGPLQTLKHLAPVNHKFSSETLH